VALRGATWLRAVFGRFPGSEAAGGRTRISSALVRFTDCGGRAAVDDRRFCSHAFSTISLKGFASEPKRDVLADGQNVLLITERRRNQKVQHAPLEQSLLHTCRQLIETVCAQ